MRYVTDACGRIYSDRGMGGSFLDHLGQNAWATSSNVAAQVAPGGECKAYCGGLYGSRSVEYRVCMRTCVEGPGGGVFAAQQQAAIAAGCPRERPFRCGNGCCARVYLVGDGRSTGCSDCVATANVGVNR